MKKELNAIITEILDNITRRYVMSNYKIPEDILAMKDETMEIFSKVNNTDDPAELELHKARLTEIKALVCELNFEPHK